MPPNSHAARLREMAEYKLALSNGKLPPPRQAALKARTIHELHADDAAAILAGAEALEKVTALQEFVDYMEDYYPKKTSIIRRLIELDHQREKSNKESKEGLDV